MKWSTKVCRFDSFLLLNSNCAFKISATVFGNLLPSHQSKNLQHGQREQSSYFLGCWPTLQDVCAPRKERKNIWPRNNCWIQGRMPTADCIYAWESVTQTPKYSLTNYHKSSAVNQKNSNWLSLAYADTSSFCNSAIVAQLVTVQDETLDTVSSCVGQKVPKLFLPSTNPMVS